MRHDSHYCAIEARLKGEVDPELFERCAVDLLRTIYPGLVPIRGGGDGGRDGEIVEEGKPAYPLVTTTSPKVLANLKRSLGSYLRNGHVARRVVIATSQFLTVTKRDNLRKAATKLGFELVRVHDGADFTGRLYRDPPWCKELLGLTGRPRALVSAPTPNRPLFDGPLIGRESVLAQIHDANQDFLLIGQPGSGKSAVLRTLVERRNALFVIDHDPMAIANDIRELAPEIVILDDAHVDPDQVRRLREIRREIRGDFRIVAASWPAPFDRMVAQAFGADSPETVELETLDRDQMVEVIGTTKLDLPDIWIEELLNQSIGLPGLAITLCGLCSEGHSHKIADGTALLDQVDGLCQRLFHNQAVETQHQLNSSTA